MLRTLTRLTSLVLPIALAACTPGEDDGDTGADSTGTETGETGEPVVGDPCPPAAATLDESACMAQPTDYVAGAADDYGDCISDNGMYNLVGDPPGSIARIEAYEEIAALLWEGETPTSQDFADARAQYNIEEGLASRVDRREDLHYDPIPMDEWDPNVDSDKQCSVEALAMAYPDRCAGPSKIRPLIEQAFIDGIEGNGDPNMHANTIKAGLLWFLYISTYKEAETCFSVGGGDCDSMWAYYSGGGQADGGMIGFGALVDEFSPNTTVRVFDGLMAVRCVRDLYPDDTMPLPAEGQMLFDMAWEQLDQALHRAFAVTLRQHAAAQDSCGDSADANWRYVQIVGEVLQREASERNAAASTELASLYALAEPTPDEVARVIELIDQVFPCP